MKQVRIILLLLLVGFTTQSNAGFPTIDVTNLVQAILQVSHAVEQVNHKAAVSPDMPNVLEFDSPLLVKILLGVTDILGS
jgi:hypothetical protein